MLGFSIWLLRLMSFMLKLFGSLLYVEQRFAGICTFVDDVAWIDFQIFHNAIKRNLFCYFVVSWHTVFLPPLRKACLNYYHYYFSLIRGKRKVIDLGSCVTCCIRWPRSYRKWVVSSPSASRVSVAIGMKKYAEGSEAHLIRFRFSFSAATAAATVTALFRWLSAKVSGQEVPYHATSVLPRLIHPVFCHYL